MVWKAGCIRCSLPPDAAGAEMTRLFPEGSGGKPSEARPEIWTDFATFLHFAERLGRTAEMLARAADDPGEDIALPRKWEEVAMGPGMMGGGGPRADMGPGAMMGEAERGRGMMRGEGPGLTAAGARVAAVRGAAHCNVCHQRFRAGD